MAGTRKGENGERGSLIWEYFRIIKEIRPKILYLKM
ncbi:MAG: DNA cytosine methyltransferase [Campylobacter sp.]